MAAKTIGVGDYVKIDGKGGGVVIEAVFRGFGKTYLVKLCGSDYEVELHEDRLTVVPQTVRGEVAAGPSTDGVRSTSRFQTVSDADVDEFIERQTNRKTLAKTLSDLKVLDDFFHLPDVNESRKIHQIQPDELSPLLCRFLVSVRKKNGEEYEPGCLRGMISSFDRQLRRHEYGDYIATSPKFAKVRETLSKKQMKLKADGKGDLPNRADPVTDTDVNTFWEMEQFGASTPDSILQTLWFFSTVHFGTRSCEEHRNMCWGDICLNSDENGHEYLSFTERQTKTRTGANPKDIRSVKPKLWAYLMNPDRCPVNVYKIYAQKRPAGYSEPEHPFYIASSTVHRPSERETWFKRNPVGVNKLSSMMKRLVNNSGISTNGRHLSNHSARKYLVQKLTDKKVPANQIMQISGHKNISSINNYSHLNQNQHKEISSILHSSENVPNTQTTSRPVAGRGDIYSQINSRSVQADSSAHLRLSGGINNLFAGPIHGVNFQLNIHQHAGPSSPKVIPRKRLRIIESDSDSQ